ncbi:ATPase, AAA family protein [Histomonas meleagridis]|uniref:ATPase, AAA family protein n=1 Tax=Histomonas meleagridis TaxID=135588 RepID=UPI003559D2E3|nr:ATPase, AAA family protein [Histomonas meleagridis]KAH0806401.1 ATPase, AAA family protein [Histomonas meleagridis]
MNFFRRGPTSHANTLQETLMGLVKEATDGQSPQLNIEPTIKILEYTVSIESSAEVIYAITESIDQGSGQSLTVLKCLKIIYLCMKTSESFCKALKSFTPEIQTITLITFGNPRDPNRTLVHTTATQIYRYLLNRGNLPDPKTLSLENFRIPDIRPKPQASKQPSQQDVHPQNRPNFVTAQQKRKENNNDNEFSPRLPAAFGGAPRVSGGRKMESLLSFDDDEDEDENSEQNDAFDAGYERPHFPAAFGGTSTQDKQSDELLLSFDDEEADVINDKDDMSKQRNKPFSAQTEQEKRRKEFMFSFEDDTKSDEDHAQFKNEDDDQNDLSLLDDFEPNNENTAGFEKIDDGDTFDPFSNIQNIKKPDEKQVDTNKESTTKSASNDDDLIFDPFENLSKQSNPTQNKGKFSISSQPNASVSSKDDIFDPFGSSQMKNDEKPSHQNSTKINSRSSQSDVLLDIFENTDNKSEPQKVVSTSSKNDDFFNPFENLSKQKTATPTKTSPLSSHNDDLLDSLGSKPVSSSHASQNNDTFDPFGNMSKPNNSPKANSRSSQNDLLNSIGSQDNNTFDPFGNMSKLNNTQKINSRSSQNDLFGSFDSQNKTTNSQNNDTFDPFANISKPNNAPKINSCSSQNDLLNSIGSQGNDTFDPFANVSKPSNAANSQNNLFDPFSNTSTSSPSKLAPKATSHSSQYNDTFDPFANASKPNNAPKINSRSSHNDLLDSFDSLSKAAPASSQSNDTFDPFANIAKPNNSPKVSAQDNDTFDPFANISKPNNAQNKSTSSTSQQNNDTFDPFANIAKPNNTQRISSRSSQNDFFGSIDSQSKTNAHDNDTFDPFANISKPNNSPKVSAQDNDTFDPFANVSQGNNSTQKSNSNLDDLINLF